MKPVRRRFHHLKLQAVRGAAASLLLYAFAFDAHGMGEQRDCGDFLATPLGKAATDGTPAQLEAAIRSRLADEEQALLAAKPYLSGQLQVQALEASRPFHIKLLIAGESQNRHCAAPLLTVAAVAGNVDAVRYLLGSPLGTQPWLPPDILQHCDGGPWAHGGDSARRDAGRRQAFAVLLDSERVDVNKPFGGRYPLGTCRDPALVALYLERGAKVDIPLMFSGGAKTLVELAVRDAIKPPAGSDPMDGVERAKLFAEAGVSRRLGHSIEQHLRRACHRRADGLADDRVCKALAGIVEAPPDTFGLRENGDAGRAGIGERAAGAARK